MTTMWLLIRADKEKYGASYKYSRSVKLRLAWQIVKKEKEKSIAVERIPAWLRRQKYITSDVSIIRETEKAYLVEIDTDITTWLPKSHISA